LTAAGRGGRRPAGCGGGALRGGEAQLLGGAARGGRLRRPVLVLPQPGHGVGQGCQLGQSGQQLRVLVRHDFHGDWNYTITAADNPDVTRPK